ncbi:MAG: extracellular solute-binding protein [Gemmiger sp.]|nr:extracellular solute-binding protein [Gemmiger sp.]
MKKMKKTLALGLALTQAFMMAACGATGTASSAASTAASTATEPSSVAASGADFSEPVELTIYVLGSEPNLHGEVMDAFNAKLSEEMNTTLKVNFLGWGDYETQYPLLLSSGEEFDLIYTATWLNFYQQAQKGAFMQLDDLLPQYAPDAWAQISEVGQKTAMVDGHVYAIPSGKSTYNSFGIIVRGDLMEKYNLPDIKTFDDYATYMQAIVDNEPTMQATDVYSGGSEIDDTYMLSKGLYPLTGNTKSIYWVDLNAEKPTVFNKFDWEGTPAMLEMMQDWGAKGYWPKAALANQDGDMMSTGKAASGTHSMDNWVAQYMRHPEWDWRFYNMVEYNEELSAMQDAMAIPASSKHPERALQFVNLIRTNQELYNMLVYGIEGKTYQFEDDGTVKPLDPDNFSLDPWTWGLRTNDFTKDYAGSPASLNGIRDSIQSNLKANPLRAYVMNTDAVKAEYAAVTNVMSQYFDPLKLGYVDMESGSAELASQLAAAGNDKVVAELQKQVDEFMANY